VGCGKERGLKEESGKENGIEGGIKGVLMKDGGEEDS
jgi:hypothetical protein